MAFWPGLQVRAGHRQRVKRTRWLHAGVVAKIEEFSNLPVTVFYDAVTGSKKKKIVQTSENGPFVFQNSAIIMLSPMPGFDKS